MKNWGLDQIGFTIDPTLIFDMTKANALYVKLLNFLGDLIAMKMDLVLRFQVIAVNIFKKLRPDFDSKSPTFEFEIFFDIKIPPSFTLITLDGA